jgi:phosphohistidine phosphatase
LRQLLLLRHAKSSWDDPSLGDHSRPLTKRGRRAAAAMGAAMRDLGLVPDIVLVSSARRTQQTLANLGEWEDSPLTEPMDALYLADAAKLLGVLHSVAPTVRSVLLIGHNPGLYELAVQLAGGGRDSDELRRMTEAFPTAALAEFSVGAPWAELMQGGGRLVRFLRPSDLAGGDE